MVEISGRTLEEMTRLFGLEENFVAKGGIDPTALQTKMTDVMQDTAEEVCS